MTMLLGLHHATALAGDAGRNLAFYTGFLGMRLVKRTVNFDDPGTHHFYYGDPLGRPGSLLTFFPWGHARTPVKGAGQPVAVAFALSTEGFERWHARARAAGARLRTEARFGHPVVGLQDPDGIAIELAADPGAGTRELHRLHSVTICETDLGAVRALLSGVLGCEAVGRQERRHRFRIPGGGYLDVLDQPDAAAGQAGAGIFHHVAMRVEDEASLLEWRERLLEAGMRVSGVRDRAYFRSVYFRRPLASGAGRPLRGSTLFELATDGPGFLIDEPAGELGTRLSLPAWLEPHRAGIEARLAPVELPAYSGVEG